MPALQAAAKTINEKIFSIAVPASILSSVGFILSITSSDPIISSIGLLLGRGTLLAFTLVVLFFPGLLVFFDKILEKTTWNPNYNREKIKNKKIYFFKNCTFIFNVVFFPPSISRSKEHPPEFQSRA